MANSFSVDAKRMEQVMTECNVNGPKVVAAFDDSVINTLNKVAEQTNLVPMRRICDRTKKMKEDAAVPIQDAIKEVARVLEEELEKHKKMNS